MNRKARQTGLTLIEIMIALLIGAFLLGGVLQIFLGSKQTYRMQDNLAKLQENGRFAMEFLAKDIRMAGYWGCLKSGAVAGHMDIEDKYIVPSDPSQGRELVLKGAFSQSVPPAITIAGVSCGNDIDTTAAYYTNTSSTVRYTINNNVLQRTDAAGNYQDLIGGIDSAQVFYGVDTDAVGTAGFGTPNYYVAGATTKADWDKVVSIRITLTIRSDDANLTKTGDGRIRRTFTTTVAVRNRLL
jgi:type IV pilus assembly protein PilW